MRAAVGIAGLVGAVALALAGCGEDAPFCGDGVAEEPEQCDDGNDDDTDYCRACVAYLPPRTVVKWQFNGNAAPGFTQDACIDLGVSRVRVELQGPTPVTVDEQCSMYQVVFDDLPPGPYMARVTPLDSNGSPLVTGAAEQQVTAGSVDSEHTINVTPDLWIGPYTGTFSFRLSWTGGGCSAMAVAEQIVTLRVGGTVVMRTTESGLPLDGSAPGPCAEPTTLLRALEVPFGPGQIEISGRNAGGAEMFHGAFDTFVGAGAFNPELAYDVPSIYDAAPPDAEPIDAGVPDAGVPDAGVPDAMP